MRKRKALSVSELIKKKFQLLPFDGAWLNSFGMPEISGSWIIWGQSGSGKTSFTLQLCKYMAQFSRVAYNSLEEGAGPTMQKKFIEFDMASVRKRMLLLNEPISELQTRLDIKKSPNIIVIDSVQYSGLNYREYIALKHRYPHKLFIYISHADGKEPKGNTARSIRFDAHVKIYVAGYRAFPVSRYGGGAYYDIWEERAREYWADIINN